MADVIVRSDRTPPTRKKYPFEALTERGESFFLPGADAHRVRQASISYQHHHPEIAQDGDKLRVNKERRPADDNPDGTDVAGVGVYRVEREE